MDIRVAREALAASAEVVEAIEATSNRYGCYGRCDAGKVSGAHLANHTEQCAHLRLLLGESVPDNYVWNGERLVFTPGAKS
jgi:hypothetical protein